MDILSFISEITSSVIWPIFIFLLVLIFRKNIISLFDKIDTIKSKDYEFIFSNEMKEMNPKLKIQKTQGELVYELKDLLKKNVDLAIFSAWRKIEILSKEKGEQLNFKSINSNLDFLKFIEYNHLISSSIILPKLRVVRNSIGHGKVVDNLSKKFAIEYIEYCEQILKEIKEIQYIPQMRLSFLTIIILEINSLIDTQKYNSITINEIEKEIENMNVLEFLNNKASDNADFSLVLTEDTSSKRFLKKYYEELKDICLVYKGDERRKWGIENLGLCLLLAWTYEIVQRGSNWKEPNL